VFGDIYSGKRVLVTGHTGFKGTWLTSWLLKLGAEVCGVSDQIPTDPSMFVELGLEQRIEHHFCDVRDLDGLRSIIHDFAPDFLFHLAAQPIVSVSYASPIDTITTNVMGTAHVLESLRSLSTPCTAVLITSDKAYENVEWEWGYKETDAVGGRDIYSGSKGAAEVIFHAYQWSFFKGENEHIRLATGRAGNVIGGGDWAKDRIVVDCMRSWSEGESVEIRSPSATRPWQHVLEPLSGYLTLGQQLHAEPALHGESFNFGPRAEQNRTVLDLLSDLSSHWDFGSVEQAYRVTDNIPFHEAGLLKLNCDKALFHLKWEANLFYEELVRFVSEWYYAFYRREADMYSLTMDQIAEYENAASSRTLIWTR
jgi:CDP-glucose 4,6-dehydratase